MKLHTTKHVDYKRERCKNAFGNKQSLTPTSLVKSMVGEVFQRLPDDPERLANMTFVDPVCGTGIFGAVVSDYLYNRIGPVIENPRDRIRHIAKNQVWMFDKSHCQIERAHKLFPDFFEPKIVQKDVLKEDIMKFDVCVGNPPYQEDDDGHGASSVPIYNHFVRFANEISNNRCLVIPAKWFSGGKGLESFRSWMLNRNDIIEIEHHENAKKFFDIKLKGGVCIVHSDDDYDGPTHYNGREIDISKYDVLVTKKRAYPIIDSVLENSDKFLSDIYYSGSFSGFTTNDDRFENKKVNGHYMKCYVSKSQGREAWVKKSDTKNQGGGFWKVIVPYGSREPWNGGFENPRIAAPDETYSRTYVSFRVDSKEQAQNLISYLDTEFAAFMLNLRKIAHHINEANVKWVPLPPLDEEWTDEKLKNRNFFDLSEDDWNYIQSFNLT